MPAQATNVSLLTEGRLRKTEKIGRSVNSSRSLEIRCSSNRAAACSRRPRHGVAPAGIEHDGDGARRTLHDMWIRLVLDKKLEVRSVVASSDAAPYGICLDATETLQCLKGLRIGPGWTKTIRECLGGRHGCTHLTELLKPLATVGYQTLWSIRKHRPAQSDADGRPAKIDSCFACQRA